MVTWNVSPVLVELGPLQLRYYSLMFIAGFSIGFQLMLKICKWENRPIEKLDSLLTHIFLGTLIGARLGHVLFYSPGYYLSHPIEILKVWEGGLASHGGGLGVFLAIYIFHRKNPEFSLLWLFDRIAMFTIMTGSFIRIGNLMNSEIIGRPTDGSWGFIFTRIDQVPRHPTQIYESVCYAIIFLLSWSLYIKNKSKIRPGLLLGLVLALTFLVRFFVEFFKENQEAFESGMLINMGQILSLPFIAAGFYLIFIKKPVILSKK